MSFIFFCTVFCIHGTLINARVGTDTDNYKILGMGLDDVSSVCVCVCVCLVKNGRNTTHLLLALITLVNYLLTVKIHFVRLLNSIQRAINVLCVCLYCVLFSFFQEKNGKKIQCLSHCLHKSAACFMVAVQCDYGIRFGLDGEGKINVIAHKTIMIRKSRCLPIILPLKE